MTITNKTTVLIAIILATTTLFSCNRQKENIIETDDNGIPVKISNMIMGDEYKIDTLYHSDEYPVIYINNPVYTQHLIYKGEDILANDPTLELDSLSDGVYQICDILRSAKVNFANELSVQDFKNTFPQYTDFNYVALGDTSTVGQKAIFAYIAAVPSTKVDNSDDVLRWLETCVEDSMPYNSNMKVIAKRLETEFFDTWPKAESDFTYFNSRSLTVYEYNKSYVTYHDYFSSFLGGAHGFTSNRFATYMLSENKPLTYTDLFKPEVEDDVRELIYESIAADEDFMANHKITSLSQVKSYIQRNLFGEPLPIPEPGLLSDGVVFCYQPYDIAPYADGPFIILIPYSKIQHLFRVSQ